MDSMQKRKTVIRTWETKKALCEEWKASGKTKTDFCREKNIGLSTFYSWCNQLWPEQKKERLFLPLQVKKMPSIESTKAQDQTDVELILSNGNLLRFKLPIKNLITFIQELMHATATVR